eukprot:gene31273-6417_t
MKQEAEKGSKTSVVAPATEPMSSAAGVAESSSGRRATVGTVEAGLSSQAKQSASQAEGRRATASDDGSVEVPRGAAAVGGRTPVSKIGAAVSAGAAVVAQAMLPYSSTASSVSDYPMSAAGSDRRTSGASSTRGSTSTLAKTVAAAAAEAAASTRPSTTASPALSPTGAPPSSTSSTSSSPPLKSKTSEAAKRVAAATAASSAAKRTPTDSADISVASTPTRPTGMPAVAHGKSSAAAGVAAALSAPKEGASAAGVAAARSTAQQEAGVGDVTAAGTIIQAAEHEMQEMDQLGHDILEQEKAHNESPGGFWKFFLWKVTVPVGVLGMLSVLLVEEAGLPKISSESLTVNEITSAIKGFFTPENLHLGFLPPTLLIARVAFARCHRFAGKAGKAIKGLGKPSGDKDDPAYRASKAARTVAGSQLLSVPYTASEAALAVEKSSSAATIPDAESALVAPSSNPVASLLRFTWNLRGFALLVGSFHLGRALSKSIDSAARERVVRHLPPGLILITLLNARSPVIAGKAAGNTPEAVSPTSGTQEADPQHLLSGGWQASQKLQQLIKDAPKQTSKAPTSNAVEVSARKSKVMRVLVAAIKPALIFTALELLQLLLDRRETNLQSIGGKQSAQCTAATSLAATAEPAGSMKSGAVKSKDAISSVARKSKDSLQPMMDKVADRLHPVLKKVKDIPPGVIISAVALVPVWWLLSFAFRSRSGSSSTSGTSSEPATGTLATGREVVDTSAESNSGSMKSGAVKGKDALSSVASKSKDSLQPMMDRVADRLSPGLKKVEYIPPGVIISYVALGPTGASVVTPGGMSISDGQALPSGGATADISAADTGVQVVMPKDQYTASPSGGSSVLLKVWRFVAKPLIVVSAVGVPAYLLSQERDSKPDRSLEQQHQAFAAGEVHKLLPPVFLTGPAKTIEDFMLGKVAAKAGDNLAYVHRPVEDVLLGRARRKEAEKAAAAERAAQKVARTAAEKVDGGLAMDVAAGGASAGCTHLAKSSPLTNICKKAGSYSLSPGLVIVPVALLTLRPVRRLAVLFAGCKGAKSEADEQLVAQKTIQKAERRAEEARQAEYKAVNRASQVVKRTSALARLLSQSIDQSIDQSINQSIDEAIAAGYGSNESGASQEAEVKSDQPKADAESKDAADLATEACAATGSDQSTSALGYHPASDIPPPESSAQAPSTTSVSGDQPASGICPPEFSAQASSTTTASIPTTSACEGDVVVQPGHQKILWKSIRILWSVSLPILIAGAIGLTHLAISNGGLPMKTASQDGAIPSPVSAISAAAAAAASPLSSLVAKQEFISEPAEAAARKKAERKAAESISEPPVKLSQRAAKEGKRKASDDSSFPFLASAPVGVLAAAVLGMQGYKVLFPSSDAPRTKDLAGSLIEQSYLRRVFLPLVGKTGLTLGVVGLIHILGGAYPVTRKKAAVKQAFISEPPKASDDCSSPLLATAPVGVLAAAVLGMQGYKEASDDSSSPLLAVAPVGVLAAAVLGMQGYKLAELIASAGTVSRKPGTAAPVLAAPESRGGTGSPWKSITSSVLGPVLDPLKSPQQPSMPDLIKAGEKEDGKVMAASEKPAVTVVDTIGAEGSGPLLVSYSAVAPVPVSAVEAPSVSTSIPGPPSVAVPVPASRPSLQGDGSVSTYVGAPVAAKATKRTKSGSASDFPPAGLLLATLVGARVVNLMRRQVSRRKATKEVAPESTPDAAREEAGLQAKVSQRGST